MINKPPVSLALLLAVFAAATALSPARAQGIDCRFYKVVADRVNVLDEPRGDSKFVDALRRDDIVCVANDQEVGGRVWAYIAYKLEPRNRHKPDEGWAIKSSLEPATQAEVAAIANSNEPPPPPPPPPAVAVVPPPPPPPPPRPEPPAVAPPGVAGTPVGPQGGGPPPVAGTEVEGPIRYSLPIKEGPYPVNGHSLEELVHGVPEFPPIEGLEDRVWRKPCGDCHQWNRESLCVQARIYARDPKMALRKSHPYGGPEKLAMMKWAEQGCLP